MVDSLLRLCTSSSREDLISYYMVPHLQLPVFRKKKCVTLDLHKITSFIIAGKVSSLNVPRLSEKKKKWKYGSNEKKYVGMKFWKYTKGKKFHLNSHPEKRVKVFEVLAGEYYCVYLVWENFVIILIRLLLFSNAIRFFLLFLWNRYEPRAFRSEYWRIYAHQKC